MLKKSNSQKVKSIKIEKSRNTFTICKNLLNVKILSKDDKNGFKFLDMINRDIKPGQVTTLANSILNMGVIRPIVVAPLSFGKYSGKYIIDGQHEYFALMRLNMDFPYVEIAIKNEQELVEKMALLNSSSKSWILVDYIKAWGYLINDYKTLNKYYNTYDFELGIVASLLMNRPVKSNCGGTSISKEIKNGKFRVLKETEAVTILDYVTDILKIVPRMDRINNKVFVSAYAEFIKSNFSAYNHAKFMSFIKKNLAKFTFVNGDEENLITFFNKGI
jgi:uncharacterized protein (DUF3820 family)